MNANRIGLAFLVLGLAWGTRADSPASGKVAPGEGKPLNDRRVSLEAARDRAKVLHEVYVATLDAMHHHYFRRDRAVLPARAMEDVFAEVDRQTRTRSRWIAVNTPAMSINHEPETEFEKKAAEELGAGKPSYDQVAKGTYQRASAIPLGPGCIGCHTKLFAPPGKTARVAGLVISIPLKGE